MFASAEKTYIIADNIDKFKINGRYAVTKTADELGAEPCITFDHTAQLLAFNADCEGDVTVKMTLKAGNTEVRASHYFLVIVDGTEQRVAAKGEVDRESITVLQVATGLKKGRHEIKIYRQSEMILGIENFISVTLRGEIAAPPANNKPYIEFLGDSITAGFGDLTTGDDKDDPSGPLKSSGTDTYAFLAAKKLGADVSIVARSGLGFANPDDKIEIYWNHISFARRSLGEYDFARKPDAVVINLGTNDQHMCNNKKMDYNDIKPDAVALLKRVRECHPDAKIVWFYGTMDTGLANVLNNAVNELGGKEKGFYLAFGEQNFRGGGGHPHADAHKANGKTLADVIRNII